jgi:hypothetical protein
MTSAHGHQEQNYENNADRQHPSVISVQSSQNRNFRKSNLQMLDYNFGENETISQK